MTVASPERPEALEGIAIIGMAGRFPGAGTVEEFWKNLKNGVESLTFFAAGELEPSPREPPSVRSDPNYVRAAGVLTDVDLFDAGFFGFLPKEAQVTDPQHRLLLECAWEAMERAGYDPGRVTGSVGVWAGMSNNTYFLSNLYSHPELLESPHIMVGNEKDYLTTRISYKLNLKGPSINVHTACSTSLVAVCQGVYGLLTFQCDMALVGGVSVRCPQKRGGLHEEGGILSKDGHTRAFDAQATGTMFSSGMGMVVLKRLVDAVADGDQVYAVIRGAAVNNDGSVKVSYAAPGVDGQAEVIATAHALAGVGAETISYVEAHGTATPLGDPIEVEALTQAFRESTAAKGFCAIGSVKTNIGHLDAAAGIAGLIKTALALHHRQIPGSLHFERPNPRIDFASSPFFVNTYLREWKSAGTPRRAGVSSFGTGGTNAHVVVEEAPEREPSGPSRPWQLLLLSARSDSALEAATANLASHLTAHPAVSLADAAFTLQVGRQAFNHRRVLVCRDAKEAVKALSSRDPKRVLTRKQEHRDTPVVFFFPGQGVQQVHMGSQLYRSEPAYASEIDRCAAFLEPLLKLDLREVLFPEAGRAEEAQRRLTETWLTQPALFVIEYALAKLWMKWGVRPQAMVGHSVGEYVAACLGDVLSLQDALELLVTRARLMQGVPPGAMLAVRLSEGELRPLLEDGLSIAAVNAPALCTVSGPFDTIAKLEERLEARGVACRRLATSHAFHSDMMDPVVGPFTEEVRKVRLRPPEIPYLSDVTGTWIRAEEATDPAYWSRHLREPVRFSDSVRRVLEDAGENRVLLEVGPGQTLSALVRQHPGAPAVVPSLAGQREEGSETAGMLLALGKLWLAGVTIDWAGFYAGERRQRIVLPTYPFERKRYWVEPAAARLSPRAEAERPGSGTLTDLPEQKESEVVMAREADPEGSEGGRRERIVGVVRSLLHELAGVPPEDMDPSSTFLEMGFDSLFLTQASQALQRRFGIKITFRQMIEDLTTLNDLAAHIDRQLPPEAMPATPALEPRIAPRGESPGTLSGREGMGQASGEEAPTSLLERVVKQQLQVMAEQLEVLRKLEPGGKPAPSVGPVPPEATGAPATGALPSPARVEPTSFGPFKPIQRGMAGGLTLRQRKSLDLLIERYTKKTAGSKRLTEKYRSKLADPRSAAGFRVLWKEMVYPIVATRSSGSKLWDVDGNEYVDVTMGFGINLFGHSPAFVTEAVREQLQLGVEIGPQSPLAGEVAELICELTGMDRVTFCNTGSEAVMAAIRVARTVTGRNTIAVFSGSYHGMFDEVLVRAGGPGVGFRARPIAPGIPQSLIENVLVLDYGTPEALEVLRGRAGDLAAVLVEPVENRRAAIRSPEFLREVRRLTESASTALIFDEVVTGFRVHPGGMQAILGIRADLATYGKVIGGGFPIGVLAGRNQFMDALDGGQWSYGDESFPEVGVTFFAGTFVRHPVALAAARAVLRELKKSGPQLQEKLNQTTARLVERLDKHFESVGVPIELKHFSSSFFLDLAPELKLASLLFYALREKGVHVWEGRGCLLSTAHTEQDVDFLFRAVEESVAEMQEGEILPGRKAWPGTSPDTRARAAGVPAAEEKQEVARLPLTEAQREVWLASQLGDAASCAFNESLSLHLRGELDLPAMRRAVEQVVERHEAFRTTFATTGESQQVWSKGATALGLTDLTSLDEADRPARLAEVIASESQAPFDLANGPLLRTHLVDLAPGYHVLVVTVHHIACDGWSLGILVDELGAIYSAELRGVRADLPVPNRFRDYAEWLEGDERRAERQETEEYWLDQFREPVPLLELPLDRPRSAGRGYNGTRLSLPVGSRLLDDLRRVSARHGCTLFMTLLGAFEILLYRLTGQDDLVIGVPAAGQSLVDRGSLVGHCVHFLPLRARVAADTTVAELLSSTKRMVFSAYEHQAYTLGTLIRKLKLARRGSRPLLVDVTFNLDRAPVPARFEGLEVEVVNNPRRFVKFDLDTNLVETQSELTLECEYNTDLFEEGTIRRWMGHFRTILEEIARDPGQPIYQLPLLTQTERQRLLVEGNATRAGFPEERCVHELFEARVERTPEAVAAVFGQERVTYGELNFRANQLAHFLRGQGVGPETMVGICLDRSFEMLVGILGTLKAGGAYVPLDPFYPPERLALLIEETGMLVLLGDERLAEALPLDGCRLVRLDADSPLIAREAGTNPTPLAGPDHLAYVIYTSGSTGRPKGVLVTHRNVVRLFRSTEAWFGFGERDVWTFFHSHAFDFSVWEIWGALLYGGRLVVVPYLVSRSPEEFHALLGSEGVTVLNQTPSAFRQLIQAAESAGRPGRPPLALRLVIFGGEALDPQSLQPWVRRHGWESPRLVNMYGITETTVHVTYRPLCDRDLSLGRSVIGGPLPDLRLYVLDRRMEPAPVGVAGELYVGGGGVARGYLAHPRQTAERFLPDPFSAEPGSRLYKTGDLARRLSDGDIEYLGRVDNQVKIRGFRIELGEIETVLSEHPGVAESIVLCREDAPGEKRLVAYAVPRGSPAPTAGDLRSHLKRKLPDHMVPAAFVTLDRLPLTPNGKVDRLAMPPPDATRPALEEDYVAPRTTIEELLAGIWAKVLEIDRVGVHDDFFELGGNSLLAMQVISRLREASRVELPLLAIFESPTVAQLAVAVAQKQAETAEPEGVARLLAELEEGSPTSAASHLGVPGRPAS